MDYLFRSPSWIATRTRHSPSEYDDHEERLKQLEKAVVELQYELALFRQQTDANFAALRLQIEHGLASTEYKLRSEFRAELFALEQRLTARIIEETRRVESKLDHFVKWMIGLQVTTIAFVAALVAHGYLG